MDFAPFFGSEPLLFDSNGKQIGKKVTWTIKKGKHGTRDGISGTVNMIFAPTRLDDYSILYKPETGPIRLGGFDFYADLVSVANEYSIFAIGGSHYWLPAWNEGEDVPQGVAPDDCKETCVVHVNGRDALARALFTDPALANDVLERIKAATGWADYERNMWLPTYGMPAEEPVKTPKKKATKEVKVETT